MQRLSIAVSLFALLAMVAGTAYAETITFKNGDRLTGEIVGEEDGKVVIEVPGIGELRVDADRIVTDEAVTADEKPEVESLEAAVDVLSKEVEKEKSPWSVQIDAGGYYSSGNTDKRGFTWAILAKRESEDDVFRVRTWGLYGEENRERTDNEQHILFREELKFDPWYVFGEMHFEKDEFENLDLRGRFSLGVGYWLEDTDTLKMRVETAPTLTYEDYRDDDDSEYKFELMFGFMAEWQINESLKLTEILRVYPDISDMPNFRLYSETALETPLAENVFAKLSLIEEYNTDVEPDIYRNDFKALFSIVVRF